GADVGRAGGGSARDRVRDRRQGGTEREDRRRLSRRLASPDRLSRGADGERQARRRAIPRVPALGRGEGGVRDLRVYVPGEADIVIAYSVSLPAKAGNPVINAPRSALQYRTCGDYW